MRRLIFLIREGVRAFSRSGLAGWLATLSLAALAAFGVALWGTTQTLEATRRQLLSHFELEAFMMPGQDHRARSLAEWIKGRDGVTETEIVSKEEAARRFSDEYGDELFNLLEENPLPVSVIVRYDPELVSTEILAGETSVIASRPEVDEVVFEGELLARFEKIAGQARLRIYFVGGVIAILAILFTLQTVRVAARGSRAWSRSVMLVGGTPGQVVKPFIFSGAMAGLIGGILGAGVVSAIQAVIAARSIVPFPKWEVSLGVVVITLLFGAFSAGVAAQRVLDQG